MFAVRVRPNAAAGRGAALRPANLKENCHEEGYPSGLRRVRLRCACGETFKSGSTKGDLKVEICSKCHPFYTGRQKLVDTGGRVDRFKKRYGIN